MIKKTLIILLCMFFCFSCNSLNDKWIGAPCNAKECNGNNYNDVIDIFKKAGFKDIKAIPVEDIKFGIIAKKDEVFEVSISLNKKFKKDDAFHPNDPVRIKYHKEKEK